MAEHLLKVFRESEKRGRAAFVGFVTAGYPSLDETVDVMIGMERGGTDIIELGVPFTDPLADGATIQKTNEVALAGGAPVSLSDCLALSKEFNKKGGKAPVADAAPPASLPAFADVPEMATAVATAGGDGGAAEP